jgi:hypothetical protein
MKRVLPLLLFTTSVFGATSTWTNASTDWFNAISWSGPVPNAQDAVAIFPATITMQPSLTASATVGSIQFNSTPTPATISGANTLIFSVSTGSASVVATTTGNTISTLMSLLSNFATTVTQNTTLNLSGNISGGATVTIGGLGTTFLSGTNS